MRHFVTDLLQRCGHRRLTLAEDGYDNYGPRDANDPEPHCPRREVLGCWIEEVAVGPHVLHLQAPLLGHVSHEIQRTRPVFIEAPWRVADNSTSLPVVEPISTPSG